jgi:hypothetical protein
MSYKVIFLVVGAWWAGYSNHRNLGWALRVLWVWLKKWAPLPMVNPLHLGPWSSPSRLLHGSHLSGWKWRENLVMDLLVAPWTENCRSRSINLWCHSTNKEKDVYCMRSPHDLFMDFGYLRSPNNWYHSWIYSVMGSCPWVSATTQCGRFAHLEIVYKWEILS